MKLVLPLYAQCHHIADKLTTGSMGSVKHDNTDMVSNGNDVVGFDFQFLEDKFWENIFGIKDPCIS